MHSDPENISIIFSKMSAEGWNISGNLKWGFFFVDPDPTKLQRVYDELKEKDYVLENVYQANPNDIWTLHVSKIETLNVLQLHKRNMAFNELAAHYDIELYDGWDVERLIH